MSVSTSVASFPKASGYKTDEFGQGSGLGLAISKVIIERLSGCIKVHSEKGKGSCFAVILSLADAPENHMLN